MHMPSSKQRLGAWGEEQACLFLARQGFQVVERNFHATQGEIDIVAKKGGDYYFVEVKTRAAGDLANDLAVTASKKYKLGKTVKRYCYERNVTEGSFILASLMVIFDRSTRAVNFRLAVIF